MITIVTGKINSGKTTYLKNNYEKTQKGDGFLSVKFFAKDNFIGYNLLHLKSGKESPFIRKKTAIPSEWIEIFAMGQFSFSQEGFRFAEKIMKNCTDEPVYLDEIGPLEILHKKGFHEILKTQLNKNLFISVRESLYEKLLENFNINAKIKKITLE